MTTAVAKLGEATLDTSKGVTWSLATGVEPVVQVFELDAREAEKLLPGGSSKGLDLELRGADGTTIVAKGLYVVGEAPSQDPHRRAVVVADRRIWWRRRHAFQRFNIRRRTGETRRLDPDGDLPQQLAPTVNDVAYARWSLKDEKNVPWKAVETLERILAQIDPGALKGGLAPFAQASVDHVEIDDGGADAVRRGTGLVVGASPYVDLQGDLRIANTLDLAAARKRLKDLGGEFVGSTHPAFVSLEAQRPGLVRCLLSVEQELRVNSIEPEDTTIEGTVLGMDNVLPIPDATLRLASGRIAVQGEYVTFPEYLAAVTAEGGLPIDDETLRRWWITPWLESHYTGLGTLQPNANWMARIGAIRTHYRRTYRLRREWRDRIFSMRAYRLAIVDEETGTFAPSVAYMDWCIRYNFKGILTEADHQHVMQNFRGSVGVGEPLSEGAVAPYVVSIVDEELGILRLDDRLALAGTWSAVFPGRVDHVPTVRMSQKQKPIFTDGTRLGRGGVGVSLEAGHRVSTVVSVAPCAPNGKGQLFAVDVTPQQARRHLPASVAIQPAKGPVWELRVGPGLATARFAWSDAKDGEIRKSFGVGLPAADAGNRASIRDLLLNAREVQDLCEVLAAQLYASLADHLEGSWWGPLAPDAVPVGTISRVTHALSPDGALTTLVSMPGDPPPVDAMALLPTSARRLFLRLAQP